MPDPRADFPHSAGEVPARTRVTVVDDDDAARRLLIVSLEAMGYAAEGVADGLKAVETIAAHVPDIVLLDLDLPSLSGAEICTLLRHHQREELRNLPVVMLTAHDGEHQEVVCLQAGANDFIAKPIGRAALAARIATQLRLRSLNDALRLQNEELERWRAAQNADLDAARRVQRAILPALDDVPGWKMGVGFVPMIQVGGDIYGVESTHEGQLVWLADATGHGVAAALCTTLVSLLFQRAAVLSDPGKVLAQVNAGMLRNFHGQSIMSAACALLLPNGEMRFSGAGHPPLLVRRATGSVERIASQGTVLGALADRAFPVDRIQLGEGDVALLMTDGLYSSRRPDGSRQEVDDAMDGLKEEDELRRLIERMRGSAAFDDDVTVITISRAD